ncbi:MAG: hypothetical protein K0Q72_1875, partial [Armatimonadetes bacterium]|nr:hypothetical protein [Armatimonadota bacterium]
MSETSTPPPAASGKGRPVPIPHPPFRRLRVYALDPSLDTRLETAIINQTTLKIPWEAAASQGDCAAGSLAEPEPVTTGAHLEPGPVGEYVEVVDYDPASRCFYEPVDLNEPNLLAQDGLEPSEGNPQFHQQMVYAVSMLTIRHFERALGRPAIWATHRYKDAQGEWQDDYVQRLRIYPHALREANAFYSPEKKALLFGYFPAGADDPGAHFPGGLVFTCLSHDIVAHEVTHALLDGMHRRFIEPTNPDVLAFHEAFADIVAMLQHFTFPEVLRHQVAKTRGELERQNVLGELAMQFGAATGRHGALRSALGEFDKNRVWHPKCPDPSEMQREFEPHARGAILVAAIFDAFLSIYKSRVADLLRLATNGSGVLPQGDIHPDLVNRLAQEAAKAAQHVLNMCIRALDYLPPVDITFGEYLRALITADFDLVRDDDRGNRLALIEAFRRRGIYPREVRTLSEDSLRWMCPSQEENRLGRFSGLKEVLTGFSARLADRRKIHTRMLTRCREVHKWLKSGRNDSVLAMLGLDPALKVEVHAIRVARRVGPDGDLLRYVVITLTQRRPEYFNEASRELGARSGHRDPDFWFRGGCTLVLDEESFDIRYCITKSIHSAARLRRQRAFLTGRT